MGITYSAPDQATIDRLFPASRPMPPDDVFEMSLVLGGTVSAGAFTAGALDFLLEALERWYAGSRRHRIDVRMVTGASGGAICAGILGLLSRRAVEHVGPAHPAIEDAGVDTRNPLWEIWVNKVDGAKFLDPADLAQGPLVSLLNTSLIDDAAAYMAAYGAAPGTPFDRPYFPYPMRLAMSLGNLAGIPYRTEVMAAPGWKGASFRSHDDYARFAVAPGLDPGDPDPEMRKREDEFWVDTHARPRMGSDYVTYDTLAAYAVASAAFPIGLKARVLTRPAEHYRFRPGIGYRATAKPDTVFADLSFPQPDWDNLAPTPDGDVTFACVDGGTFNNDPVRLAHQALAGMFDSNPRDAQTARRGMLMIDPLAAAPANSPTARIDLASVTGQLLTAVTEGARYLTADMALFGRADVYSRFQVVPVRDDKIGEKALATDFLSAFGGFFCRAFRVHDFQLGRINMQNYLRTTMVLRGDNCLFNEWKPEDRERWAVDADGKRVEIGALDPSDYYLPIIPDTSYIGTGAIGVPATEATLTWPVDAFHPTDLAPAVRTRIAAVLHNAVDLGLLGDWVVGRLGADLLTSLVMKRITGYPGGPP